MSSTSSAVPPATISGRRFVGILLTVIALLLLFAFAGWFRTSIFILNACANRPKIWVWPVPTAWPK